MNRILVISATALGVVVLVGTGVAVNAATLSAVPSTGIGQATSLVLPTATPEPVVDDSGHHATDDSFASPAPVAPGIDDHGGATAAPEPGDDHGGASAAPEPGDDHSGATGATAPATSGTAQAPTAQSSPSQAPAPVPVDDHGGRGGGHGSDD